MPEYLAPAVFVEETSFRSKSIEGVSTSTAAFVGLTSRGAVTTADGNAPPLLTSFANFERLYGGFEDLQFSTGPKVNYLAHAARAFYDNGGGRLYVARILGAGAAAAKSFVHDNTTPDPRVFFEARNPGGAVFADARKTNLRVTLRLDEQPTTLRLAQLQPPGALIKVVGAAGSAPSYFFLDANSTRLFGDAAFPGDPTTPVQVVTLSAVVEDPSGHNVDYAGLGLHPSHPRAAHLVFGDKPPRPADALGNPVKLSVQNFNPAADTKLIWDALVGSAFALWGQIGPKRAEWGTAEAEAVTADATAAAAPGDNARKDAAIAKRGVAADKLGALLAALAASLNSSAVASMQHDLAAAAKEAKDAEDKAALAGAPQADKDAAVQKRAAANDKAKALAATLTTTLNDAAIKDALTNPPQSRRFDLIGGSDGTAPPSIEAYKDALKKLGALEDISIIASPGAADLAATSADGDKHSAAVNGALVIAAEAQRSYRIAVLDTPPDKDIGEVRAIKGLIDSKYAALYYPWVIAPNPLAGVDPRRTGRNTAAAVGPCLRHLCPHRH